MRRKLAATALFLSRCRVLVRHEGKLFALFIVLSVLGALTEGVGVSLVAPILEKSQHGSSFAAVPVIGELVSSFSFDSYAEKLKAVSLVLLGMILARGALQYVVEALGGVVPLMLQRRIAERSFDYLLAVPARYLDRADVGDLIAYVHNMPNRVTAVLTAMARIIYSLMVVGVYTSLMVAMSWQMTVAAVAFMGVVSLGLTQLSKGPLGRFGRDLTVAQSGFNQTAYEYIDGMKLVRLFNAQDRARAGYQAVLGDFIRSQTWMRVFDVMPGAVLTVAVGTFICVLLYVTATLEPENAEDASNVVLLFLFFLFRLLGPLSVINQSRNTIASNLDGFETLERFYEYADAHPQQDGEIDFAGLKDVVRFENVAFAYDESGEHAVRGLDFAIERGRTVALVGPSGAGKTTVASLLTRLFDPAAGAITVDGVDLRDLRVASWRARLAVVSQDITIFNATVADNLRLGRPDATEREMWDALEAAAAVDFVRGLPDGLDTSLGNRGVRLSGGQKQRIAIARAVLSDPEILVLDEATSALDSRTETEIQRAIERLASHRTVLVIAHRLSTISRADRIVVLRDGRIVEQGAHADLVVAKGVYWELLSHHNLDLVDENGSTEPAPSVGAPRQTEG